MAFTLTLTPSPASRLPPLIPAEQMHRSMCPADVLPPDAAKLHGIIVNLHQQLAAEVGDKLVRQRAVPSGFRAACRGQAATYSGVYTNTLT